MRKPRRGTLPAVTSAVVLTLAGAVLGVAVQDIAQGLADISVVLAILGSSGVVAVLVFLAHLVRSTSDSNASTSKSLRNIGDSAKKSSEMITAEVLALKSELGQIVEYQLISDLSNSAEVTHVDYVTRAVKSARSEILVLDLVDDQGQRPISAMSEEFIQDFVDLLFRQVDDNPNLRYRRICQVSDPSIRKIPSASRSYLEHCIVMCKRRTAGDHRLMLKVASVRYPFKFILIDNDVLVLQLNRMNSKDKHREAWCELIFNHGDRELIRAFRDMWQDIEDAPLTRPVDSTDLVGAGNGPAGPSLPPAAPVIVQN